MISRTHIHAATCTLLLLATLLLTGAIFGASAAEPAREQLATDNNQVYGPELQGFDYPHPVQTFSFTSQRQPMKMAYMEVRPKQPNGRVAVLLHGKYFCAATWDETIETLAGAGYRVIAPDQIGLVC